MTGSDDKGFLCIHEGIMEMDNLMAGSVRREK